MEPIEFSEHYPTKAVKPESRSEVEMEPIAFPGHTSSQSKDEQSENTSLLKEILSTLQSIESRVTNIEEDVQDLKESAMSRNTDHSAPRQHVGLGARNPSVSPPAASNVRSKDTKSDDHMAGLGSAMAAAVISGEGGKSPSAATSDNDLAKGLRNISQQHLTSERNDNEKAKPKLVSYITEKFILPSLESYRSDVSYMGSAYEFTTVPGKSDYDIQFFIKLPQSRQDGQKILGAQVESCGDPAWAFVKGGTADLLDNGYLSTEKARKLILSTIDKALQKHGSTMDFEGDRVTLRRSTGGPATTLNVEWRGEKISIDVVICLKAADLQNGKFDLVAKPYDKKVPDAHKYWRLSYSKDELKLLREYHLATPRKLILLRIMKVIKQHQSQLKIFPSYFFKNILFKLCEENPQAGWDRVDLALRFKEMIQTIQRALELKDLRLHFNKQVNYLADKDPHKIKVISNYLKGIITKDKYVELVRVVPGAYP